MTGLGYALEFGLSALVAVLCAVILARLEEVMWIQTDLETAVSAAFIQL